jgi:hypothetical protein
MGRTTHLDKAAKGGGDGCGKANAIPLGSHDVVMPGRYAAG